MSLRQLETRALEKVWGRNDIPPMFGQHAGADGPIGEIWFEGTPSDDLLVKYLFTSEKLSIQVHPSDELARASGYPRGKDEAWYVLSAKPGAVIGAGFATELSQEQLRAASIDGSIDALMTWHPVEPGDFFYVPAGTVHAIGAGLCLLEIQQNVDLTYRLYDYRRPRELQLDEGIAASAPGPIARSGIRAIDATRVVLAEGPKLVIEKLCGPSATTIGAGADSPVWLMPIDGECTIDQAVRPAGTVWLADSDTSVALGPGDCLLIAYAGKCVRN